jgi:two-component system, LytTR family, sensor histidine kinase AlgZ
MASIKQNHLRIPVALPDFRSMGVHLRILLLVNAMALVAAVVRSDSLNAAWLALLQLSGAIQPILLGALLSLFALSRGLARLPYKLGTLAVLMLVLMLTTGAYHFSISLAGAEVQPPLWRIWFLSAAAVGTLLLYFNLHSRTLSPAITEARLQALQARIRPHFLFNTLNAALSLIRSDPRRAETALEDMADLFRVLMADNRQLVPLKSELELCRQYLSLEKLRLGDRLQLIWHIDNMPEDALIPPLLLQPLLENAVYHGIEPYQEGGEININLYRSRDLVHLVLTNPYRLDGDRHNGNKMALSNIRDRLTLHFDAEAQLMIKVTGNQYRVHIVIPYRRAPSS